MIDVVGEWGVDDVVGVQCDKCVDVVGGVYVGFGLVVECVCIGFDFVW